MELFLDGLSLDMMMMIVKEDWGPWEEQLRISLKRDRYSYSRLKVLNKGVADSLQLMVPNVMAYRDGTL